MPAEERYVIAAHVTGDSGSRSPDQRPTAAEIARVARPVPAQRGAPVIDGLVVDARPIGPRIERVVGPEPVRWRRVAMFVVPAFALAFTAGAILTLTGVTSAAFHLIASVIGVSAAFAFLAYAIERVSHRRPGHSCPRCLHH